MQQFQKNYFTLSLLILIIISLAFNFGCAKKKEKPEHEEGYLMKEPEYDIKAEDKGYTHILARYVSAIISGTIKPTDPIRVKFVSSMIEPQEVGKEEKERVFSFSPSIKGKAIWKDRRTLEFIPHTPLKERQVYTGELDINNLIEEKAKIKPLHFKFQVAGREIIHFKADFIPQDEKHEKMKYSGKVEFSLPTKLSDLEKAFSLKLDRSVVSIIWQQDNEYTYQFSSEIIKRDDTLKNFKLNINKKPLNLSENFIREFNLETLHEMKVIQVLRNYDEKSPSIEIEFSDELDRKQDINGLVIVEPDVRLQLQKFGKRILGTGNFSFGKRYDITVTKGIKNIFGNKTKEEYTKEFSFNDQKPQIIFSQDGVFLPSSNERKIRFRTLNLRNVHLTINKVFESNLCFFLQDQKLDCNKNRSDFNYYRMNRVGIEVINKKLEIGEIRNKWLQHELDLSSLIPENEKGLFLVRLNFTKKDTLYRAVSSRSSNRYDYYSNPRNNGYYYRHGSVYKPVVISDIGLTYKKSDEKHIIYANDVLTTKPLNNCQVILRTYQNQVITEGYTNSEGNIEFPITKENVFFIQAFYKGQQSIVKLNEMAWNLSTFDVEGVSDITKGTRAFIYTERGVYRPGDEINISMIFRNQDNTFPENHPVQVEIFNPQNQKILERTLKDGKDGFYHFSYTTQPTDMTGNWNLKVHAGSKRFSHNLKIETVVAERLKVVIEPEKEQIKAEDDVFIIDLRANYLFGNPASGLQATLKSTLYHKDKKFKNKKYVNYIFNDATIDFKEQNYTLFDNLLDENGSVEVQWKVPDLTSAPSSIIVKLDAEVLEKGGRGSKKKIYIPFDPFECYVGIESSSDSWVKIGKPSNFNVILLDDEGDPQTEEELIVRIYRNNNYWWWEFDNRNQARLHFKSDTETEMLREEKILSRAKPVEFEFIPERWGEYLIEVSYNKQDGKGHTASRFFNASYWGRTQGGMQSAGAITLKTDKPVYHPGEKAEVTFPVPSKSMILVSIEKGDKIIDSYWYKPGKKQTTGSISIPITKEMLPNIYCSISVIQPHQQTDNDRPIRMYGVIPINVEDEKTRRGITLNLPEKLCPNEKFTCKIQTKDKTKTQFTIAVVDEGLLSLTDFQTPDPWKEFFRKIFLGVKTYDNYGYIIGANKGDVFKIFSIGGGLGLETYRKGQQAPEKTKRFKPVCMFKGPMETNDKGIAEVEFEMPEYIGAVRIMVISADKGRFGSTSKTVPVKNELMILPTLPRMLAPMDKFSIPVEVFAMEDGIKSVNVSISIQGPIKILKETEKTVTFDKAGDKSIYFSAEVLPEVGTAKITINARSEKYNVQSRTDIAIRPYSPRIYSQEEKKCSPGESVTFLVPDDGIKGTNNATLTICRTPRLDIGKRIDWLIRFPYGCIEQTTSAVFPQLYLKSFMKKSYDDEEDIDYNINTAIKRLRKFQLTNGSFTYWPGNLRTCEWGTNYAGHFLLEAKKLGYFVPRDMLANWIRYQQGTARKNMNRDYYEKHKYTLKIQLYRLYLLALAESPEIGAMNYLKEDVLPVMNDTERWMLASAYNMAGVNTTAEQIALKTGIIVKDYTELAETYGSGLRDKAIILDALLIMNRKDKAEKLYLDISDRLSSTDWFSTQTLGYSLLSLGKYIQANKEDFNMDSPLIGEVTLANQEIIPFNSKEFSVKKNITDSFGEKIGVHIDSETKLSNVYLNLNWDGVPLKPTEEEKSNGLKLKIRWFDINGNSMDPSIIKQGEVFKAKIQVEKTINRTLENIALVQILPSGWEIENERINPDNIQTEKPKNKYRTKTANVDYTDIRDDRIMWFFNMIRNEEIIEVEVKLRAVTIGEFELPPTLCEVMYDNKYQCIKAGRKVSVVK